MTTASAEQAIIARRYASAIFALATEVKSVDETLDGLQTVKEVFAESAAFRKIALSPLVSARQQQEIVVAVLKKLKASDLLQRFFAVLAENRRMAIITAIADAFAAKVAESRNETTAEVTSAEALSKTQIKTLQDGLKKAMGRNAVHLLFKEDLQILGGMKVKIDGKMLDNSLSTKMERLATAMRAQA